MSYQPPAGNNVNFELKAYTPPAGNAVNFDFTPYLLDLLAVQTVRNLSAEFTNEYQVQRVLSKAFNNNYQTLRLLKDIVEADYQTIRWLGFGIPTISFDTLRLLHLSKNLLFNVNRLKAIQFPIRYWRFVESEFSQGDHSVTKAFEHYLSFTDDYDFCWGPEVEGRPLKDYEIDYTERLWGVYTKTAGEIYLLKANEDMTGWEREERLTFAPSGSHKARIVFDKNGHYVIVAEIIPANGKPEIWIFEYPYEGSAIRKLFDGNNPGIFKDFDRNIYVFYQPNDNRHQINYRSSTDGYSVDYVIESTKSEKIVEPREIVKVINENNIGYILAFYWRDDDIRPIKYAIAGPYYIPQYYFLLDEFSVGGSLQGIEWVEIKIYEEDIKESFNVGGSLHISWQYVGPIEIGIKEDFNVSGGLQDIEWVEINIYEKDDIKESFSVGGSLQQILWLEVESE